MSWEKEEEEKDSKETGTIAVNPAIRPDFARKEEAKDLERLEKDMKKEGKEMDSKEGKQTLELQDPLEEESLVRKEDLRAEQGKDFKDIATTVVDLDTVRTIA